MAHLSISGKTAESSLRNHKPVLDERLQPSLREHRPINDILRKQRFAARSALASFFARACWPSLGVAKKSFDGTA